MLPMPFEYSSHTQSLRSALNFSSQCMSVDSVLVLTSPIRPYIPCYTCLYDAQILVPNASVPHFDVAVVLLQGAGIDASAYVPLLQRLQVDGASAITGSRTAVWAGCPQCVYFHPFLLEHCCSIALCSTVLVRVLLSFSMIKFKQDLFSVHS